MRMLGSFCALLALFCTMSGEVLGGTEVSEVPTQESKLPSLVALYESIVTDPKSQKEISRRSWYILRSPGHVELRSLNGTLGELWQREADGQIYLIKLFHEQKRAIDYFPGDLLSLEQKVDWKKINRMIDTRLFGKPLLLVKEDADRKGEQRFKGVVTGVKTDVTWLKEKQFPAKVMQQYSDRTVVIALEQLWPIDQAPVKHTKVDSYQHVDYSDIGDLEADPFFRQLAHQSTELHSHSH